MGALNPKQGACVQAMIPIPNQKYGSPDRYRYRLSTPPTVPHKALGLCGALTFQVRGFRLERLRFRVKAKAVDFLDPLMWLVFDRPMLSKSNKTTS